MLLQLAEFRRKMDEIMCACIRDRITLYGYGYTGRFLRWYAKYYHNIDMAYVISEDMHTSVPYEMEVFRDSLFDYQYKDFDHTVIWLAVPMTDKVCKKLKLLNQNQRVIDFYFEIYGNDLMWKNNDESMDRYHKHKEGLRDIQFMEYLEWKYECNFLTMIDNSKLEVTGKYGASYRATTQKELFAILDHCHCMPKQDDALFDFGCGKGSVLVGALDYGFNQVGGVEYEPGLYEVLVENRKRLGLSDKDMNCICGNAANLEEELDKYNWFYFWAPFGEDIFQQVIRNMRKSLIRVPRKIRILYSNPVCQKIIDKDELFRLTNQFTVETRQRAVNVYESLERISSSENEY